MTYKEMMKINTASTVASDSDDQMVPANDNGMSPGQENLARTPDVEANDNLPPLPDGHQFLKNAKQGIEEWADEFTNVREGRCDSAKVALKGVIYFACWCLDEGSDPKGILPDWGYSTPTYRNAIDYAFHHAAVLDDCVIKSDTAKRSQWAKITAYVHKEGEYRVDEEDFLDVLDQTKGGIRGMYKNAIDVMGKTHAGRGGKKASPTSGATTNSSVSARVKADLSKQNMQAQDVADYVLILLDANQGKNGKRLNNPRSPQSIVNNIGKMDQFVTAWNATDDDVNGDCGILAMFNEDVALEARDEDEVEAVQSSGGDDV